MPDVGLDLRYLNCALKSAELGSLRQASAALDLPQSTVSRRVQLLERRLGFSLFSRDSRGVTPTAAGARFLQEAVVGANYLRRAARSARADCRGESGQLRVGLLTSLNAGLLRSVLRRFRENYPDLQTTLQQGIPEHLLNGLTAGDLDVCFLVGQTDVSGHLSKTLWNESILVALPDTHSLAGRDILNWGDLRSEPFVVSRAWPGYEIEDCLVRMLSTAASRPQIEVHDVSHECLFALVAMGFGLTLASTSSLLIGVDGVAFRPIDSEDNVLPLSAVWSSRTDHQAVRKLLTLAEAMALERQR